MHKDWLWRVWGLDYKISTAVSEDHVIDVSPFQIVEEFGLIEFLQIHHVAYVVEAIGEFLAIFIGNWVLLRIIRQSLLIDLPQIDLYFFGCNINHFRLKKSILGWIVIISLGSDPYSFAWVSALLPFSIHFSVELSILFIN